MKYILAILTIFALVTPAFAEVNLDGTSEATPGKKTRKDLMFEFKDLANVVYSALPLAPVRELTMPQGVEVKFNFPGNNEEIEDYVVKAIDSAEMEILFNQTAITSQRIAAALVNAKLNGKTVAGIIELSPLGIVNYNAPGFFILNNIAIFYDSSEGHNTNNYCIIDRTRVITGSLDWTKNSDTKDSGNIISIKDPGVVTAYYNAWVRQLTTTYVPKATEVILHTILSNKQPQK